MDRLQTLLNTINEKSAEYENLINQEKFTEAVQLGRELDDLQNQFDELNAREDKQANAKPQTARPAKPAVEDDAVT